MNALRIAGWVALILGTIGSCVAAALTQAGILVDDHPLKEKLFDSAFLCLSCALILLFVSVAILAAPR